MTIMEERIGNELPQKIGQRRNFHEDKGNLKRDTPKRNFKWGQSLKYEVKPEEVIYKTASLPPSCTDASIIGSPIQEFFSGAHVLITGATGFMGKILVEKLLTSCPKLEKIYLIIREKKGQSIETRFDKLFDEPIFARLRTLVPDFRQKVVAINGDCAQLGLGMSDEDSKKLSEVMTVIIHGAATVRFDEKIRMATNINIRGVREILNFSRKCQNIKSVVHISTAYANAIESISSVEEKFYPPAYDYEKLMELVEREDDDKLAEMTPALIAPWPNTYAFTKQIAEDVVRREGEGLPLAIYRPAVVIATAKEPIRSWSDNIYGPTGIILGTGTGVLRTVHADPQIKANVVPVDLAVNGVIAAAWKAHQDSKSKYILPKIYNYVSSYRNAVTWDEFNVWNGVYGRRWPSVLCIWYPMLILIRSKFLHGIVNFAIHTTPAYLVDAALYLTGNETKLVKAYQKISKFCKVIAYFATRDWQFPDNNVAQLWSSISQEDKEIYPFDITQLDWDMYFLTHLLGLRVHIAKDPIETIQAGRLKYKRQLLTHIALLLAVGFFWLWIFSKLLGWRFV